MKVTCKRKALLVAVQDATRIAGTKGPKPILRDILLTADGGQLELRATDLETGTMIKVAADVQEQGTYAVPAAKLVNILKASTGADVHLETASTDKQPFVLGLTIGASKYRVLCEDPAEFLFADLESMISIPAISLPAETLRTMIGQTLFATDTENLRYALNGVLFEVADGALRLVATDGRRLAVTKTALQGLSEPMSIIVPKRALSELYRALKNQDGEVCIDIPKPVNEPATDRPSETGQEPENDRFASDTGLVIFRLQDRTILSRLLEGKFPPWREVVPENADKLATINVKALVQGIEQASIQTSELSNGVGFIFQHNELTLKASSAENGDAEVTIPVVYDGPNRLPLTLNPGFVFDFLKVVETDDVELRWIDEKTQVLFTTGDTMYVVMPIVPREEAKVEEAKEEPVKIGRVPWPNGLGADYHDADGGYHQVSRSADGMYHSMYSPGPDFPEPTRIGSGVSEIGAIEGEIPADMVHAEIDASSEPLEHKPETMEIEPVTA